jgi:hypothetical protein
MRLAGAGIRCTHYRDRARLGANKEADSAASASRTRVHRCPVTVLIQPLAHADRFGRAGFNAQAAAFAFFPIDPQQPSIATCCTVHFAPSEPAIFSRRDLEDRSDGSHLQNGSEWPGSAVNSFGK